MNYMRKQMLLNNPNPIVIVTKNSKEYKLCDGTYYSYDTPNKVIDILESARRQGNRIRIFYGNPDTGEDYKETEDVLGYIGRSTGEIKVPVIVYNKRSTGGSKVLDQAIIKITADKHQTLYQHPQYYIELTKDEADKEGLRDFLLGYVNVIRAR